MKQQTLQSNFKKLNQYHFDIIQDKAYIVYDDIEKMIFNFGHPNL